MGFTFSGSSSSSTGVLTETLAGATGNFLGPGSTGNTTFTPANSGDRVYVPVFVPAAATFDWITLSLSIQAGTTGTARLGIYANTNGRPSGAPILDAGTVSLISGTGVKEIVISQALAAGLYFLVAQFEYTGTAPGCQGVGATQAVGSGIYATATTGANRNGLLQTGATGALDAPGSLSLRQGVPFLCLRYA